MDFKRLLGRFTQAVESGDGQGLASLFAEDGVYIDGFYGPFEGRDAIAKMIEKHFYGAAENFKWTMSQSAFENGIGYATYLFSYDSTMPEAKGCSVIFEGMSRFEIENGAIKVYKEIFDRGAALVQLGFDDKRICKSLGRWNKELRESERVSLFKAGA